MKQFDRPDYNSTFGANPEEKLEVVNARTEEIKKAQAEHTKAIIDTFDNPVGRKLLKDLQQAFCGVLLNENPHVTSANAAKRDIFDYINRILDDK